MRRRARVIALTWLAGAVTVGSLVACSSSARPVAFTPPPTAAATVAPTSRPTPSPTVRQHSARPRPRPARPSLPAFVTSVGRVTAADLPHSWRPGCPVSPAQLRAVHLTFYGFDHHAHRGTLVVNATVTSTVQSIFRELYGDRFPIRSMQTVDAYGGDDNKSMAADNTSAFNCRAAVSTGPKHWSVHAYGEAIDVNTVENPYIFNGSVLPPNGAAYSDRSNVRPGMAVRGGTLVRVFKAHGWGWGGDFAGGKDYQHFSINGK